MARTPTLKLGELTGIWAKVYRRRDQQEAAADRTALTAWRDLLGDVDLADVIELAAANPPPAGTDEAARLRRQHLQHVLAAAVLARLTLLARQREWPSFVGGLAASLAEARAAGADAGAAVSADVEDVTASEPPGAGAAEEVTAYTLAAEALRGLAAAVARVLLAGAADGATTAQLAKAAHGVLRDGLALTLALNTAVAAAFIAGLATAYLALGIGELDFVTAGDSQVCAVCDVAEQQNPYPAASVPRPPLHPHCRCTLQPA